MAWMRARPLKPKAMSAISQPSPNSFLVQGHDRFSVEEAGRRILLQARQPEAARACLSSRLARANLNVSARGYCTSSDAGPIFQPASTFYRTTSSRVAKHLSRRSRDMLCRSWRGKCCGRATYDCEQDHRIRSQKTVEHRIILPRTYCPHQMPIKIAGVTGSRRDAAARISP